MMVVVQFLISLKSMELLLSLRQIAVIIGEVQEK